jgi:hypothetical protein
MDANQRSEVNNQTNNGANEKWTPGSQGKTADNGQPLDHTYPQGAGTQQMGNQSLSDPGTQQTGAGPGQTDHQHQRGDVMGQYEVAGGSMQTQIEGGSGAVEGITDSHQRQMEQKSGAYGLLEQPVGHRPKESGVDVNMQHDMRRDDMRGPYYGAMQADNLAASQMGGTQGGGMAGPTGSLPPHAPAGSIGNRQSGNYGGTQGGGMAGPHSGARAGQEAEAGNTQLGVSGSGSASNQNSDYGGVHDSNDVAGGLPRSPGNSGPLNSQHSTDRGGSQTGTGAADIGPGQGQGQLQSNDASGHYPRSPGYANRLAGDRNMDDDTGFKRK